jgi:hypothetical protein
MSGGPREPFALHDAMILVALVALSLAGGKAYADYDRTSYLGAPQSLTEERFLGCLTVFLLIANAGLLLIRIFRKRHQRRNVVLDAGTSANLACLATLAFVALTWANVILCQIYKFGSSDARYIYHVFANVPYEAGQFVLTVWAILALSRRWRAKGWLEQAGVAIGIIWVLFCIYQNLGRWMVN